MKGYKGFAPGLICRDKQYTENTVFKESKAKPCFRGMHFCPNPFEVLKYYPIINENCSFNEFAEVKALDKPVTDDDIKFASKKLKIGTKFNLKDFIKICINFVLKSDDDKPWTQVSNDKNYVHIANKGDHAQIGNSGDLSQICSSGRFAKIGDSGDYTQIGVTGKYSQIGTSGDCLKIANVGDYAQIGASGKSVQICNSGDYAQISSSGAGTQINITGKNSVVMCAGKKSRVKAKIGSWITLADWSYVNDEWTPICVKTEYVDGKRIKENTFYTLKNGEFVEW